MNDVEVVQRASRRWSWRIVLIVGLPLVLIAGLVVALVGGGEAPRDALAGDEVELLTTSVDEPTSTSSSADESSDSVLSPGPTATPTTTVPRTAPSGFTATYDDLVAALRAQDSTFVDAYCATYNPPPWHLPDLVGRNYGAILTSSERAGLVKYTACISMSSGLFSIDSDVPWSRTFICTSDSSLVNIIASQVDAPGTALLGRQFGITLYKYCEEPTTTTTAPMPPTTTTWVPGG